MRAVAAMMASSTRMLTINSTRVKALRCMAYSSSIAA
jgi:hypothetical protein